MLDWTSALEGLLGVQQVRLGSLNHLLVVLNDRLHS